MVANPDLGRLEGEYHASRWRMMFPTVITGVLLASGIPMVLDYFAMGKRYTGLVVPGIAFALGGMMICLMIYANYLGRSIEVYEQGVRIGIHGRTKTWYYDDLKAFRITARRDDRYGYMDYQVKAYHFYTDRRHAFTVHDIYPDWNHLGMSLVTRVRNAVVPQYISRIKQGQDVVFDGIRRITVNRRVSLKFSLQGLAAQGKPMVPWGSIQECKIDPADAGRVIVYEAKGQPYTAFQFYNSTNSVVAMRLINMLRQT